MLISYCKVNVILRRRVSPNSEKLGQCVFFPRRARCIVKIVNAPSWLKSFHIQQPEYNNCFIRNSAAHNWKQIKQNKVEERNGRGNPEKEAFVRPRDIT